MLVDVSPIMPRVLEQYSNNIPNNAFNPEAWVRLKLYYVGTKKRYITELIAEMAIDQTIWKKFGFPDQPSESAIYEVLNKRLDNKTLADIEDLARTAMIMEGETKAVTFGENVSQDSTPIPTTQNDPDGKYNGHYKCRMLKANIALDLDHKLELESEVYGGTEYDGDHAYSMFEKMKGFIAEDATQYGDGHFSSAAAWAILSTTTNYQLKLSIEKGFTITVEEAEVALKKEYQRHHTDSTFNATDDCDEMARWLVEKYVEGFLGGVNQINQAYELDRALRRLKRQIWKMKKLARISFHDEDWDTLYELANKIIGLEDECQVLKTTADSTHLEGDAQKKENGKHLKIVGQYYKSKAKAAESARETPDPNLRSLSETKNSELKRTAGLHGIVARGVEKNQAYLDTLLCLKFLFVRQRLIFGYRKDLASMYRLA